MYLVREKYFHLGLDRVTTYAVLCTVVIIVDWYIDPQH